MSKRLLSHTVLAGVTVGVVGTLATALMLPVALSLYTHVLIDLLADVTRVDGVVVHGVNE